MYDRAMDKLRDEIAKTKSKAVGMVGEIVTLYLMADEANAEKILHKEKTLSGAYAAMKSVAQKGVWAGSGARGCAAACGRQQKDAGAVCEEIHRGPVRGREKRI